MLIDKKRLLVKTIKQDTDYLAIMATIVFFVLALLVPSVKIFFVLAFALFGFLTVYYSFPKAVIYTAIPLSYIGIAQIHTILVVPASAITSNQYWEGKHLSYGFSPFLIISVVALLLIPVWRPRFRSKLLNHEKWLIILFACGLLSSVYASLMVSLSIFSVFTQFTAVIWAWYLRQLLIITNKINKRKIISTIFFIITALIAYETLIVFRQTITQAPVGLTIEMTQFVPSFGTGNDEQSGGFRAFGLQTHPNGLANQQLILLSAVFLLFVYLSKTTSRNKLVLEKNVLILTIGLSLINIILSLSRATFLALIVGVLIIIKRHYQQSIKTLKEFTKQLNKIPLKYKLSILPLVFILIFKISTRLLDSIYSFSEFGGINTRVIQYVEAIEVFKKSPFFGIADKMFIPMSYQLYPKGVMSYFPENVHNGFLLFIIERGLLGTAIYLIFLFFLYKEIIQKNPHRLIKSVIYSGLIAGFTIMIFHPERNLLSNFVLLVATLGTFNYEKKT